MSQKPRVSIITINYNQVKYTCELLDSLRHVTYPDVEVIVVDNCSPEDPTERITSQYPEVTYLRSEQNLGFAGGNNLGIKAATGKYLLFLNNDTEVNPNFLQLLVEAAEQEAQVGIVGPTIYYFDQPETIWSAGGAIDWQQGNTSMIGLNQIDRGQFGERPRPVDFVTGWITLLALKPFNQAELQLFQGLWLNLRHRLGWSASG